MTRFFLHLCENLQYQAKKLFKPIPKSGFGKENIKYTSVVILGHIQAASDARHPQTSHNYSKTHSRYLNSLHSIISPVIIFCHHFWNYVDYMWSNIAIFRIFQPLVSRGPPPSLVKSGSDEHFSQSLDLNCYYCRDRIISKLALNQAIKSVVLYFLGFNKMRVGTWRAIYIFM